MKVNKALKKLNPDMPQVVTDFFGDLTAVSTTLPTMSKGEVISTLGRLAQKIVAGDRMNAFKSEWETLVKNGKINNSFVKSNAGKYSFIELLKFIESEDNTDEEVYQILKQILIASATSENLENEFMPLEYMKIIRNLTSGEVIILTTSYDILKNHPEIIGNIENTYGQGRNLCTIDQWNQIIMDNSSIKHAELVKNYEAKLIEKKLILDVDGGAIPLGNTFRLTGLAYGILKFIDGE